MLFCVNDPAPLPESKGRRDFDRPTPSQALRALIERQMMLARWPGDRSHYRATDGAMDAVGAGLPGGMFLTGDQAIPLGDQLLQIESCGPGDLLPVRGAEQRGLVQPVRVPVDQRMIKYIRHAHALTALTGLPSGSKKRPAQKSSAS